MWQVSVQACPCAQAMFDRPTRSFRQLPAVQREQLGAQRRTQRGPQRAQVGRQKVQLPALQQAAGEVDQKSLGQVQRSAWVALWVTMWITMWVAFWVTRRVPL